MYRFSLPADLCSLPPCGSPLRGLRANPLPADLSAARSGNQILTGLILNAASPVAPGSLLKNLFFSKLPARFVRLDPRPNQSLQASPEPGGLSTANADAV